MYSFAAEAHISSGSTTMWMEALELEKLACVLWIKSAQRMRVSITCLRFPIPLPNTDQRRLFYALLCSHCIGKTTRKSPMAPETFLDHLPTRPE